jgi:hypothetical protein
VTAFRLVLPHTTAPKPKIALAFFDFDKPNSTMMVHYFTPQQNDGNARREVRTRRQASFLK